MYNYAQALSLPGALAICPPLRVCLPLIGCADIRGRGSMQSDSDRVRADLAAIGMRASGSAVGLLQLLKELLDARVLGHDAVERSEEHTSELQSLIRISYAVFCWKNKNNIILK